MGRFRIERGQVCGGEGGIRTHGTREGTTVFETVPIDHSGTSPRRDAGAVETAAGGDRAAPLARSGAGRKRVDVVRCDFRIR